MFSPPADCSVACQKQQWKVHKAACRVTKQGHQTPPVPASPCAPRPSRLPRGLRNFAWVPSADGANSNLLLLLHGLGDTEDNYRKLAERMQLPQTCVLTLRGPGTLPFGLPVRITHTHKYI